MLAEILRQNKFTKAELEKCSEGLLFHGSSARLPSGPLLLIDEVTDIKNSGGHFNKGLAKARIKINPDQWYFEHHFKNDPIVPGCFLIESMWQLTGLYLAWSGYLGRGRVIDSGRTRFFIALSDSPQTLELEIHIRKTTSKPTIMGIANGVIFNDGHIVCQTESLKIGLIN